MASVDISWEASVPARSYAAVGEKKRAFLKRGEGVMKRVLAPRHRQIKPMQDSTACQEAEDDVLTSHVTASKGYRTDQGPQPGVLFPPGSHSDAAYEDHDDGELLAETSLVDVGHIRGVA